MANARKLRMIFQNDSKSDRLDAEQLARVARMDTKLLYPIEHRNKSARTDLSVMRSRQRQSGQRNPELRIIKAGDQELRRLLVQCAQQILGPFGKDSRLRRWDLELASRGWATAKKKAVVAVARKLAVLLQRLWLTGEVYQPLRNTNRRTAARIHKPVAVAV